MSYNPITLYVEEALASYVEAATLTFSPTLLRGIDPDNKVLPAIMLTCTAATAAQPELGFTGQWDCDVRVALRENADDTSQADHIAHWGEVADLFCLRAQELASELTREHLTVQWIRGGSTGTNIVDRSWESYITFTINCHGG